MARSSKNQQVTRVKQLILGTKKHFPDASAELKVGGNTFTVTTLTEFLQSLVDEREAVEALKAALKTKLDSERTRAQENHAVLQAYTTFLTGRFGAELPDFGLVPPRARAPLTDEQKAVAVAKRLATRAARHTGGKNQKKNVKGSVTATLVVTPVTPSTGPSPAAPAGAHPPHER